MHRRRRDRFATRPSRGSETGAAEVVVLGLFAAVIGAAFFWALVLHGKPRDEGRPSTTIDPTATSGALPPLPPPRRYRVDGGVNVRQGAGTNTTVLATIDDGAKVTVECRVEGQYVTGPDGSSDQWLRIQLDDGVGYVTAIYVDVGNDLDDPNRIGVCR